MIPKTGIHWFRNDLRLHDNPALNGCQDEVERFIPIFIFDEVFSNKVCGYNRYRFLLQTLEDLERQFKKYGLNLMCFYGKPHEIIENLIKEWNVKMVTFSKDSEYRHGEEDELVRKVCESNEVQVIESASQTLYDPEDICHNLNYNETVATLDEFKAICDKLEKPERPLPTPSFNHFVKSDDLYVECLHKVPTCEYFKLKFECIEQNVCLFPGGETKALELLDRRLELEKIAFKSGIVNPNKTKPIIFTEEVSLSPYFRFGCLSIKKFYWDISKIFLENYHGDKTLSDATEQLYWREYFYQLAYRNQNFKKIEKNIMSFKIPWEWNVINFEKWENGRTGFPWIDACMRQLKQEGWIHHICRNSVAIFLTRGDMFHSWEKGLNTFLKYLIDADASICAGNWNYISCGDPEALVDPANCFCPIKNGKKIDPDGHYIRKYVPELKNFDNEYLFEPWKASLNEQEEAECIIGQDYPEPMLDHDQAFIENVAKLNQFFQTSTFAINNNSPTKDYKAYTYIKFLEDEFDDF